MPDVSHTKTNTASVMPTTCILQDTHPRPSDTDGRAEIQYPPPVHAKEKSLVAMRAGSISNAHGTSKSPQQPTCCFDGQVEWYRVSF